MHHWVGIHVWSEDFGQESSKSSTNSWLWFSEIELHSGGFKCQFLHKALVEDWGRRSGAGGGLNTRVLVTALQVSEISTLSICQFMYINL